MAYDLSRLKTAISETEEWLRNELSGIRTGRASPALLDSVRPDAYGVKTPLAQLASVTIEDARTLRVIPWDKGNTKAIEKGITDADLGVGVSVDDQGLRVNFPELTAERRTLLKKLAGERHEQAKVTLRGHRTEAMNGAADAEKAGGMGKDELERIKAEIQKLIDAGNAAFAALAEKKDEEISR
ncbi:MAG: ribosome recycling factor [Patescibacteria group bacterium]|nr:ribosome recycling factor [Patescibacteria group bacterium]MDE1966201.1 ribosome recycling factor [Patescibacteria group bacterium]